MKNPHFTDVAPLTLQIRLVLEENIWLCVWVLRITIAGRDDIVFSVQREQCA